MDQKLEYRPDTTPPGSDLSFALVGQEADVIAAFMLGLRSSLTSGLRALSLTIGFSAGGRVTGKEVIAELVVELRASVQQAEQFEGEMRNLAAYARALAQALDCIRSAGGSR